MKFLKIVSIFSIAIMVACGSSQKVIMDDGTIYKIKNNSFYHNGKDISAELTSEEKAAIKNTLNERIEAQRMAEDKKKELAEEQEKVEEALKRAKERQEELEANQEQLEEKIKAREEAREDVLKAKERLLDKKERYETLKAKGKLSPRDEEKWQARIAEFEAELNKANEIYKQLK